MQQLRRLLGRRSVRSHEGAFVVEGVKLLVGALDAGAAVESVYVDSAYARQGESTRTLRLPLERSRAAGARIFHLAPGVVERVADTVTPQPVLAVVRTPRAAMDQLASARLVSM